MKKGLFCLIINLLAALWFLITLNFSGFMGFASSSYLSWKLYQLKT